MKLSIPRSLSGLLLAAALALGARSGRAAGPGYDEALAMYRAGDFAGVVAKLEAGSKAPPVDIDASLLLGLAYLRLDRPDRAARAWSDYVKEADPTRSAKLARLRTLVIREGNVRAARAAVELEKQEPPRGVAGILAVFPLRNTGGAENGALVTALSAMLSANLSGLPTEEVIGRDRVERFVAAAGGLKLDDTEQVARIGRLLRAANVVVGTIEVSSTTPATVDLDTALIETASGRRVESASFVGPIDRFYAPVRDTAVILSNELGWPVSVLPQAPAARVQATHTKSLPAATAYGRGLDLEAHGDFDGARAELQAALREDPSFELARRQLATLPEAPMTLGAVADTVEVELLDASPASRGGVPGVFDPSLAVPLPPPQP
ncbi:MAG: hypothetical protein FJ144_12825 [Deltaproteobacteria bacterium]|nr:hypothetical protein [Deltaproteobacteria bacterium]